MGNGGSKHAVRRVAESMPKHNYVFRTDPGTVDRYSIRVRSQLGKG